MTTATNSDYRAVPSPHGGGSPSGQPAHHRQSPPREYLFRRRPLLSTHRPFPTQYVRDRYSPNTRRHDESMAPAQEFQLRTCVDHAPITSDLFVHQWPQLGRAEY
uniref:Uncharacterized protein n=1 Tax=uncultured marine group II/III euryarchaeote KM3_14_C07 TaxID=1457888 RepID=A0A075GJD2_9EURY|nr:hypothetical protein [uncultured marine group II/III euryarchaeote KM3_14_C07]